VTLVFGPMSFLDFSLGLSLTHSLSLSLSLSRALSLFVDFGRFIFLFCAPIQAYFTFHFSCLSIRFVYKFCYYRSFNFHFQVILSIIRRHFASLPLTALIDVLLSSWLALAPSPRDVLWQDFIRCAVTYMTVNT
jgi:hypothetical protein